MNKLTRSEAVQGILFSEDRKEVLLIKRKDVPVWVLPGGGVEDGESPEAAVCREVLEETGYEVKILRKVGEYLPVNRLTRRTHLFECTILSGAPSTGAETKEVHFFSLLALPKLIPPPYRDWIKDAHANLPEIIRRKMTGISYWLLFKLLLQHPLLVLRFLLSRAGIPFNR